MLIRFVRFLRPADGVSEHLLDTFRRDEFGPLVAGHQTEFRLVRYVQTHRCSGSQAFESAFLSLRPGARNDFVGVDEFWWKDEESAVNALVRSDGRFRKILQSHSHMIDPQASVGWLAVDYPQVSTSSGRVIAAPKSGIMKLMFAVSPLWPSDELKARRYWLTEHGPLIRSLAPARGTVAYIQVHRQRDEAEGAWRSAGLITESSWMGHAEAWFKEAEPPAGADGQAAVQAAVEDERHFIDWSRSCVLVGKELVFVDRNWF